jgi:DNA-binding MarR family transcriptional regulator
MLERAQLIADVRAAMRRLTTSVDGLDQRAAEHFGITRADLRAIDNLRSGGPMTASELAAAVGISSGGLSIALERLERSGYLRRTPHPDDRRSVLIEASEAVAVPEQEVFGELGRRMHEMLSRYGDGELRTIRDYLEGAAHLAEAAAPRASGAR